METQENTVATAGRVVAGGRRKGKSNLSPKEQRFVEEYVKDFNGIQSIHRAGYNVKNDNVAGNYASTLLKKPKVAGAIAEHVKKLSEKAGVDVQRVLKEAMRLSFVDPVNLFNADGSLKLLQEMDEDTRRCIASVEVFEEYDGRGKDRVQIGWTKKIKFWDKNAALDKLFRYLALYNDVGSKNNPLTHRVEVVYEKMHTAN